MKKIKVLQFICPSGFYGAEMWILALCTSLDRNRVDSLLAVTRESEEQNLELYKRFKRLGLQAECIPMTNRFDVSAISSLISLIKKERIDIIHTHGYKSEILGLAAARLSGIKILSTPHGFENVKDLKLQLFIKLGCFALRFVDKVSPLSPELEQDCLNLRIPRSRIKTIINGVDLTEINQELANGGRDIRPESDEKIIGYVGQMIYRKNVGALIEAFDIVYKTQKNVRLLLIGDGPARKQFELQAQSLPSSSRIEFLGYREDRLRFVRNMDVFCMTSSLEGIPRCMMEAMALGTPVTAFEIPGVDQLIRHGKTGLLAEFNDIQGLKENLASLLMDESLAKQIGQNGRQYILDRFSSGRMANEYERLYQNMNTSNKK